jgi:hypothetical protein
MAAYGAAQLRAAIQGRAALESFLTSTDFDPDYFTTEDHAALGGSWSWLLTVVRGALASGPGPVVDDNPAYVAQQSFSTGPPG